jgi:hypothetical protein
MHMTFSAGIDFTVKQINVHYSQSMHRAGDGPDAAQGGRVMKQADHIYLQPHPVELMLRNHV